MKINRLMRYIADTNYRQLVNSSRFHLYDNWDDEAYLKQKFKLFFGRELSLDAPKTFNEKLQWLKLYDRRAVYTVMADKYAVKTYVADAIGEQYIVPTLGVWDDPAAIDFEALPERFVLKCNHNSGLGMYICRDKTAMDVKTVRRGLKKGLKENYFLNAREWPYKDIPRKILAETYLSNGEEGLTDYKVHCFDGVPRFILVCKDRFSEGGLTQDFFTPDWEPMALKRPCCGRATDPIDCPDELEEILRLSAVLSQNIPFVRVDFYIVDHRVYFSELTFYPAAGFGAFDPSEWDEIFGSWLSLPTDKAETVE